MPEAEIALVTGAARGVGLEVARQLVEHGFRVLMTGRDLAATQRAAAEVGGRALRLDVASPDDVAAVARAVVDGGGLDVLVNNAGTGPDFDRTTLTVDFDEFEVAWQTNLLGPWRLTRALEPVLRRAVNPRVVNVTAASGSHGDGELGLGARPTLPSYGITKAALGALTHKLAADLPGARVNAVDPGRTATVPGMESEEARPVADGAASVVWAATLGPDGPTGGFFRDGRPLPW